MMIENEPGAGIPFAGLPNLRDLGGWSTGDGRRVREGLMFRSADLDRLDAAGLTAIGRLFDGRQIGECRGMIAGRLCAQNPSIGSGVRPASIARYRRRITRT
jgi:hypothetical protein